MMRCAWWRARCWDKLSTSHIRAARPQLVTTAASRASGTLGGDERDWPLLREPAPLAQTWAIRDVPSTPLWQTPDARRRQRVLCAAPCALLTRDGDVRGT